MVSLTLFGPVLAIPFTYVSASHRLGELSRRIGWFMIPEELEPPDELRVLEKPFGPFQGFSAPGGPGEDVGLAQTILNPRMNAIHVSLLRERPKVSLHTHERLVELREQLLLQGPGALLLREKRMLLWDADSMLALHQTLWSSPVSQWHQWWQDAFQKYMNSLQQHA